MHPLIRAGKMDAPGVLAMNYPPMTAVGFFMLHIAFGILVGTSYAAVT